MASRADSAERLLDDHPLLAGSLEDFEADHRGTESECSSAPGSPAFNEHGGWYHRARSGPVGASKSLAKSKSPSCDLSCDDDVENTVLPANIPLPPSPEKGTPHSVQPLPEANAARAGVDVTAEGDETPVNFEDEKDDTPEPETSSNCMCNGCEG